MRPWGNQDLYKNHMKTSAKITIDENLRFIFFAIQCILEISIPQNLIEKIFFDSKEDQISEKKYLLFENKKHIIKCIVKEYEPETIQLNIDTNSINQSKLNFIVESAMYELHHFKNRYSFIES